jgi:hypothetical protein
LSYIVAQSIENNQLVISAERIIPVGAIKSVSASNLKDEFDGFSNLQSQRATQDIGEMSKELSFEDTVDQRVMLFQRNESSQLEPSRVSAHRISRTTGSRWLLGLIARLLMIFDGFSNLQSQRATQDIGEMSKELSFEALLISPISCVAL